MQGLLPLSRVGTVAVASFLRQHHYVTAVLWVPQVRGTLWIASWKQSGVWLGCSLAEPWACGHCGLLPLLRLLRSSIPKEGVCWGFSLTVPPAGFPGSKRLGSRLSLHTVIPGLWRTPLSALQNSTVILWALPWICYSLVILVFHGRQGNIKELCSALILEMLFRSLNMTCLTIGFFVCFFCYS